MLSMALKNLGLSSDFAENGAVAVEAIARDKDRYEAIFLDYTMPVMVRFYLVLFNAFD